MAKNTKAILRGSIVNPQVADQVADLLQDAPALKELAEQADALTELAENLDGAEAAEAVAPIADPATATAEDVATALNSVIAALQAAKLMKEE